MLSFAAKNHRRLPSILSSAYMFPSMEPMKTASPTTSGLAQIELPVEWFQISFPVAMLTA